MALDEGLRRTDDALTMTTVPDGQTKSPKRRTRFSKLKTLCGLGAVGIMALVGSREFYRQKEVQAQVDSNGAVHYQHDDGETTAILDYLAGQRKLTAEEIQNLIERSGEKDPERANKLFPLQCEDTPGLYQALWQMEKEAGSPLLRWTFGKDFVAFGDDQRVTSYNPVIHTVTITPHENCWNMYESWIGELAHSHQFEENALGTLAAFVDQEITVIGIFVYTHDIEISYQAAYHYPGSGEYDAHSVRQPQLLARFTNLLASYGKNTEQNSEPDLD